LRTWISLQCVRAVASCRSRSINSLICERCDLLLFYFIVGEGLLVLLPVLAGRGRLIVLISRGHGHVCMTWEEVLAYHDETCRQERPQMRSCKCIIMGRKQESTQSGSRLVGIRRAVEAARFGCAGSV
jgi:hypothetical protein